jgi:lipoprotein-releasing system permease protein
MFQPWPSYVGLRYVRARSHRFFVSFITWVSLAGVALGVAALIVVLSVMNGFEGELRDRLLALSAHARVVAAGAASAAIDPALEARLRALPGVAGVAPYSELQALAVHQPDMLPVTLRGIDPAAEGGVTDLEPLMVAGHVAELRPGSQSVVLGAALAEQLGVAVGGKVTLLVPVASADAPPEPRLREFTVTGMFEAGIQDHDASLALASLADVRAFAPQAEAASGWRLRFHDALAAPALMPAVRAAAPGAALVRDWSEDHASYFRAIRIEKTMMALILLLIVAVAAFNIVAMLVMVVSEKRTDIAILRTLGASPGGVLRVFLTQGLVIGWSGVLAGVGLGVLVARNVGSIVPVLERLFRFSFLDADVYYITRIPSELHLADVLWIGSAALVLTLGATLYPALRAAATPPAAALRYE